MLIDTEVIKIKEWADGGDPQCQLLMYRFFCKGQYVAQSDESATKYLIAFLQNDPLECMGVIKDLGEVELAFSDKKLQDYFNYIYYVTAVGIFLLDKSPIESTLWFKKAIDLSEDLLKFRDEETKIEFRLKISAFQYWPEVLHLFNETKYIKFNLDWENKLYMPDSIANKNDSH